MGAVSEPATTEPCEDSCGRPRSPGKHTRFCDQCRARRRRKPVLYPWTPALDDLLRSVYAEHHSHKAIAVLVKRIGYPRHVVKSRALHIGASTPRRRESAWSEAELALLRDHAWMVPERIRLKLKAAGFTRTTTACAVQRKRLGARQQVDGMSAAALATTLGVDNSTVLRWISKGWLHALRSGTTRDNHDAWHVTSGAVRAFLLAHHDAVEFGKAERAGSKLWLLDLLTGGASDLGSVTTTDSAEGVPEAGPGETKALIDDVPEAGAHKAARAEALASVAGQVNAMRLKQGMTLPALARRTGVSPAVLDVALRTGRSLTLAMVASMATALGAEVEFTMRPREAAARRQAA